MRDHAGLHCGGNDQKDKQDSGLADAISLAMEKRVFFIVDAARSAATTTQKTACARRICAQSRSHILEFPA
jgi:hypothetical protein